jgi:hypothetical protein
MGKWLAENGKLYRVIFLCFPVERQVKRKIAKNFDGCNYSACWRGAMLRYSSEPCSYLLKRRELK